MAELLTLIKEYRDTLETGKNYKRPEIREKVMDLIYKESLKLADTLYLLNKGLRKKNKKSDRKKSPIYNYGTRINDFHNLAGALMSKKSINRVINHKNEMNILPPGFRKLSFVFVLDLINIQYPICMLLFQSWKIKEYIDTLDIKKSPVFKICEFDGMNYVAINSFDEFPDSYILKCIVSGTTPTLFKPVTFDNLFTKYTNIKPVNLSTIDKLIKKYSFK